MYDKIKRFYEEDHQSIRWIVRELNLNFRTVKKYLEMDQREFEQFSDTVINRGGGTSLTHTETLSSGV